MTNKKVLIFIPVWGRFPETKLTYQGVHRIQKILKEENIDSQVLVVSSEKEHTELALEHKFLVTECDNFPISDKHNCGLDYAMSLQWDYLLQMGSNNLLSNIYIRFVAAAIRENYKMFGGRLFYNILPCKTQMTHFKTRAPYKLSGVGRGIRRDIIEDRLKIGPVWDQNLNKGLDKSSRENLTTPEDIVAITTTSPPSIVDIRTNEDINDMSSNPRPVDKELFVKWFPELKDLFT
jgi:hypothetical protein